MMNGLNQPHILPRFAQNAAGQLFMIAPPPINGQQPLYYLPHYTSDATNGVIPPRVLSQPITLPQQAPSHLQQIQANVPPASPITTPQNQPSHQSKEETNAKIRNIKDKTCISHYVEGQVILETPYPLTQVKFKTKKKEKRRVSIAQSPANTSQDQKSNPLNISSDPLPIQTALVTPAKKISEPKSVPDVMRQSQSSCKDDIKDLRNRMTDWSVEDVVKFVESHEDIRQYSTKFADDEVDGKALLLMIDRNLNLQMLASMFKHGPAMKIEAVLSRYKLSE